MSIRRCLICPTENFHETFLQKRMKIKQTSRKNCDAFIPGSLHILVTNYILRNIFVTSLPKTTKNQVTKMG